MLPISPTRRAAQIFLWLVPFVFAPLLAVLLHASHSKAYLVAGAALDVVMLFATWVLGLRDASKKSHEHRWLAIGALLLIAPLMAVSLFAGLGPPPQKKEWLATLADQNIRYILLVCVGLFAAGGLTVLKECLRQAGEHFYSGLGFAAILFSTVLFVFDMTGHLSLLPGALHQWEANGKMPEWFAPVWQHNTAIFLVGVALTYLGTAAYVAALRSLGWMGKTAARVFSTISLVAAPLVVISPLFPAGAKLGLPIFILAVPAVPFFMPYLIGVNLMRREGDAAS